MVFIFFVFENVKGSIRNSFKNIIESCKILVCVIVYKLLIMVYVMVISVERMMEIEKLRFKIILNVVFKVVKIVVF